MMNAVSVDRNWRSEEEGLALRRERVKILGSQCYRIISVSKIHFNILLLRMECNFLF